MSEDDPEPLSAIDKSSFAYKTVKERIPTTLTQIIDALHRMNKDNWESHKAMINKLSQLRYEVMTDKRLAPLDPNVASPDFKNWDRAFRQYEAKSGKAPTWFTAPWLLWECYVYRCIQLFAETSGLADFDVFEDRKHEQFEKSIDMIEVASKYVSSVLNEDLRDSEKKRQLFDEFLQVCLWGNECDLSISNMSQNALEKDPFAHLAQNKSMIVVDDSAALWDHLTSNLAAKVISGEPTVVTVILDNAGPELFGDLCFADFLLTAGFATRVEFQGKAHPWFVSDVTAQDFSWTLEQCVSSQRSEEMRSLGKRWQKHLDTGSFRFGADRFWTSPFDFAAMAEECPELHERLAKADLIVFKGDLNYRKLVGDLAWPPTTSFDRALRGFRPAPLVSLRVCKADVTVGLCAAKAERLASDQPDWMVLGKYAVIQAAL